MAQIKKFQEGGKMFIDGHEINLEDYYKYASSLSGQARTAAMDMYNSARSGSTVNYNSGRNAATGVTWSDINQEGLANADRGKGWTRAKARRQAFWGGKGDDFVRALQAAGRFTIPEPKKPESAAPLNLFDKDRAFDYNEVKDENGKISRIWSDSLANADILNQFNTIRDAVLNWNEDDYKTKYDDLTFNKLKQIRSRYDLDNEFFTGLERGFKGGNFDNQELWDNLNYMRFFQSDKTGDSTQSTNPQDPNDPWSNYINPFGDALSTDVLRNNNARITKDENGMWHFYGKTGAEHLSNYDFLKGTQFEDGLMLDGNMYTKAQFDDMNLTSSDLSELRRRMNIKRGIYGAANSYRDAVDKEAALSDNDKIYYNGIGQYIGESYSPSTQYLDGWYEAFRDLNPSYNGSYEIIDATGQYSGLPEGAQIMEYVDPFGQLDSYSRRPIRIIYRDKNGRTQKFNSRAQLQSALGVTPKVGFIDTRRISPADWNVDGMAAIKNFRTNTGNADMTLYRGKDGTYRIIRSGGWFSPDKYWYLDKNSELYDILVNGNGDMNSITDQMIEDSVHKQNKKEGIGKANVTDKSIVTNKLGGKIKPLPKFQYGGMVSNVQMIKDPNTTKKTSRNTTEDASMLHSGDMTNADWMELGAIAGDLVGFGASFVPVYGNIASGVIGLGSSATQLAADIKRDGFDGGDLTRFGASLGMDALGLIPVVGSAAKATKLTKVIAKAAPILNKVAKYGKVVGSAAATSAAINVANEIANGKSIKDFTVDDIRNVAMVIQGIVGGGRNIYRNSAKKAALKEAKSLIDSPKSDFILKMSSANPTINGLGDINLSKKDLKELQKLGAKEDGYKKVSEYLTQIIKRTHPDLDITPEIAASLAKNYGLSEIDKHWYNPKTWHKKEGSLAKVGEELIDNNPKKTFLGRFTGSNLERQALSVGEQGGFENLLKKQGTSKKVQRGVTYWNQELPDVFPKTYMTNGKPNNYIWNKHGFDRTRNTSDQPLVPLNPQTETLLLPLRASSDFEFKPSSVLVLPLPSSNDSFTGQIGWKRQTRYTDPDTGWFGTSPTSWTGINNKARAPKGTKSQSQENYRLANISKARALNAQNSYEGIKSRILTGELRGDAVFEAIKKAPKNKQNYILNALSKDKDVQLALRAQDPEFALFYNLRDSIEKINDKQGFSRLLSKSRRNAFKKMIEANPEHFKDPLIGAASRAGYKNYEEALNAIRSAGLNLKNGGQIIKAENGLNTTAFKSYGVIKPEQNSWESHIKSQFLNTPIKPIYDQDVWDDTRNINKEVDQIVAPIMNQHVDTLMANSYIPAKKPGAFNWNKLADLGISASRYIDSAMANKRLNQLSKEAIEKALWHEQMPTEIYNRFQDNGVTAAYNSVANQERQIKPVSSDFLKNRALEDMANSRANQIELEGKLKLGEMYQQHAKEQQNLRRQYAQQRNEIANRNMSKDAATASNKFNPDIQTTLVQKESDQNASVELQNRVNQKMQKERAFDMQVAQMQYQNRLNPNRTMTDEDIVNLMKPMDPRNFNGWFINQPQYAKKGTKLRSRLDADEQIWVDNNKAVNDAIKKINDNIMKLIMKVLS